ASTPTRSKKPSTCRAPASGPGMDSAGARHRSGSSATPPGPHALAQALHAVLLHVVRPALLGVPLRAQQMQVIQRGAGQHVRTIELGDALIVLLAPVAAPQEGLREGVLPDAGWGGSDEH